MKYLFFLFVFLCGNSFAQESKNVTLILTYKNAPLCNYSVSIFNKKKIIGTAISNELGEVNFKNIELSSKNINVSGMKLVDGKQKSWILQKLVVLDEKNTAKILFEEIITKRKMSEKETIEEWGLNSLECKKTISEVKETATEKLEEKNYTSSEIAKMNDSILEKLKPELQNRITQRNALLKKFAGVYTATEKKNIAKEIEAIENQIGMMDVELSNRKIKMEMENPELKMEKPVVPVPIEKIEEKK